MPVDSSFDTRQKQALESKKKKQQIVVVVLLAGLLIAVLTQPTKTSPNASGLDVDAQNVVALKQDATSKAEVTDPRLLLTKQLPKLSVNDATADDLFPLSKVVVIEEAEIPQEKIQVFAIYGGHKSTNDRTALVGDQIIRKKHKFSDGREVLRVTPKGLEVLRKQ